LTEPKFRLIGDIAHRGLAESVMLRPDADTRRTPCPPYG